MCLCVSSDLRCDDVWCACFFVVVCVCVVCCSSMSLCLCVECALLCGDVRCVLFLLLFLLCEFLSMLLCKRVCVVRVCLFVML